MKQLVYDAHFGKVGQPTVAWRDYVDVLDDDDVELYKTPQDVVDVLGFDPATGLSKAEPKTLYVKRRLMNSADVRAWVASQGIKTTRAAEDMHVTIAFSREPVDWSLLRVDEGTMVALGGERFVHQFPAQAKANGALVLRFESPGLHARWRSFLDAGASWDYPTYSPHVTLTYSVPEADAASIQPYTGPLVLGPEEFAEINAGRVDHDDVEEVPTTQERHRSTRDV